MNDSYPLNWVNEISRTSATIQLGKHNRIRLSIIETGVDKPVYEAQFEQWKRDYRGELQYYTEQEMTSKSFHFDIDEIKREVESWWSTAVIAELSSRCPACGSFATGLDEETNTYQCYECGGVFDAQPNRR